MSSEEDEAEQLFLKATELEKENRYYDAVKYYRRAMQLVPDIDMRVFRKYKQNEANQFAGKENIYDENKNLSHANITEEEFNSSESLFEKFLRIFENLDKICLRNKPQKTLHISDLPSEVITYILKWVVSDELDLRSLEQCSLISRGFYLQARDPHIWRLACERAWKNEPISLSEYDSWRDMLINKLRIYTNGCYIGETRYYRQGERSFQENYKPCLLVVYYRYLRFFVDGTVLMISTPDMPVNVIGQLKTKTPKHGAVIVGSYTVIGDIVYLIFRVKRNQNNTCIVEKKKKVNLTYHIKLQIKKLKKWRSKLIWKEYKWTCPDNENYDENFEIRENAFPPLQFSRVKSYTAESEAPLS